MTAHHPTSSRIHPSWKLLGFLALFIGLCTPLLVYQYRPNLQQFQREQDRQLLITQLRAAGIRCRLQSHYGQEFLCGLEFNNQEQFERFVRLIGRDDRAGLLKSLRTIEFQSVQITSADLERLKGFPCSCLGTLEFHDCTLPPEFLTWMVPFQEVGELTISHSRIEPQLPPPHGSSLAIRNLTLDATSFGENDLLLFYRHGGFWNLTARHCAPRRAVAETLASQTPPPFPNYQHINLESVPLEPWLPVLARCDQQGHLSLMNCEMTSSDLEQVGGARPSYGLDLRGAVTPELLLGLSRQQHLTYLNLRQVQIDEHWEYALGELPSSLQSLSINDSHITSVKPLLRLPPTLKTVSLCRTRVDESTWLDPMLDRPSYSLHSINPGLVLEFDPY